MSGPPSRGDRGDKPAPARSSKPTPVRALDESPPTRREDPGPPPERAVLEVAGRAWTAEVAGRAHAAGGTALVLVRFTPARGAKNAESEGHGPDEIGAPGPTEDDLEAWVIGSGLDEIPEDRLVEALGRAGPWRGSEIEASFFADEGGRRGR